jgi:hypothetical protein
MNVVERLSEILCATREMEVWVDIGARTSCACVERVWESKRGRERETDIEGDTEREIECCPGLWKAVTTLIILYFLQTCQSLCESVSWDTPPSSFPLGFNSTSSLSVFYI